MLFGAGLTRTGVDWPDLSFKLVWGDSMAMFVGEDVEIVVWLGLFGFYDEVVWDDGPEDADGKPFWAILGVVPRLDLGFYDSLRHCPAYSLNPDIQAPHCSLTMLMHGFSCKVRTPPVVDCEGKAAYTLRLKTGLGRHYLPTSRYPLRHSEQAPLKSWYP